jgi:spore coat protein CotH
MKVYRFAISFVLCSAFLVAAREYSGVVVSKTDGSPVVGALVSVEHSEYYARTDQSGRFSITDPTPEGEPSEPPTAISKVKLQNARWNFQGRSLDLRATPGVNSVSIYTTNGKKVFSGPVPSSRIVSLPSMAMGIYILELHGERGVISRGSTKLAKEATDTERLIFRHDDYLPKDIDMTNSNTDMRIELSSDVRSFVFDQSKIREYRFTMNTTDLDYMNKYGWREEFKPASLSFEGKEYKNIGIRYKGSDYTLPRCFFQAGVSGNVDTTGTPNKTCKKISYKLKFTQYDKDLRFYGMKKINLHAFAADETKMHEIISYELFRDMGIHAPRVSYANVYVNNTLIGLFLAVEEIDGRFTKSRWPEYGDGNLYKEVWPKSADAKYYLDGLKTNNDPEDNPNTQKMVSYYNAINSSNEQNFKQNLSSYMDFDHFLRYLVVDVPIKNWDGIRSWYWDSKKQQGNNHNYYFYEEENSNGKIWIVPWDMDQALVERDSYFDAGGGMPWGGGGGGALPQWNVPTTNCAAQAAGFGSNTFVPPNCDKLFKLMATVFWDRYVLLGDKFLNELFTSQRLNDKITRHQNLINNAVQQDPNIQQSSWSSAVNSLKNYLPNNISSFRSYLHP